MKKRASSRHAGTGAPLTAERARATSVDSLATRAGSGELDHYRQVRRRPLVKQDQLVGLGATEPPAARQRLESLPLRPVRGDERVDVHALHASVRPMADLVTGEAVVLDLRLARLPSRAVAISHSLFVQVCMLQGSCSWWGRRRWPTTVRW